MNGWRAGLLALMLLLPSMALASPPALPSTTLPSTALTPAQQAEAERISGNLRCPICSSQSITESGNDISREMRAEVARMVAEGRSEQEIYDYFSARYGNFILLDPPKEGAGLLLWLAPLLALGAGGYWLSQTLSRNKAKAPAALSAASARQNVERNTMNEGVVSENRDDLTPYLTQVRTETMRASAGRETSGRETSRQETAGPEAERRP